MLLICLVGGLVGSRIYIKRCGSIRVNSGGGYLNGYKGKDFGKGKLDLGLYGQP